MEHAVSSKKEKKRKQCKSTIRQWDALHRSNYLLVEAFNIYIEADNAISISYAHCQKMEKPCVENLCAR